MTSVSRLLPLAAALAALAPAPGQASGQLIFATGEVFVLGADGTRRPARQGEPVRPGERVVTGSGALAQVKLEDGSYVGVRADSDLRIQAFSRGGAEPGAVLVLDRGSVRVLNLENGAAAKPLPVRVQSSDGAAVLVRGGDLESGRLGTAAAPMIARVNAGVAVARTTQGEQPLAMHGISSVTPAEVRAAPPASLPPIVGLGRPDLAPVANETARSVAAQPSPIGTLPTGPALARPTLPQLPGVAPLPTPTGPVPIPYPNLAAAPTIARTDLFLNPGIITSPTVAPVLSPTITPTATLSSTTLTTTQILQPVVQPTIILSPTTTTLAPTTTTTATVIGSTAPTTTSTLQIGGSKTTLIAPTTSPLLLLPKLP